MIRSIFRKQAVDHPPHVPAATAGEAQKTLPKFGATPQDPSGAALLEHAAKNSPNASMHKALSTSVTNLAKKQKSSSGFIHKCGQVGAFAASIPVAVTAKVVAASSCLIQAVPVGAYAPAHSVISKAKEIYLRELINSHEHTENQLHALHIKKDQMATKIAMIKMNIQQNPSMYKNGPALLASEEQAEFYLTKRINNLETKKEKLEEKIAKKQVALSQQKPLKERIKASHHSGLKAAAPFNALNHRLLHYSMPKHADKVVKLDKKVENVFAKTGSAIGFASAAAPATAGVAVGSVIAGIGVAAIGIVVLAFLEDD